MKTWPGLSPMCIHCYIILAGCGGYNVGHISWSRHRAESSYWCSRHTTAACTHRKASFKQKEHHCCPHGIVPLCKTCKLTHWGRVTHICFNKLTIIGSDNGLSPGRRQASIWTNAGILLIWPLGTNFSEIWVESLTFSFKKMRLKVSSAKRRPFCLGLNVLILRVSVGHMLHQRTDN